MKGELVTQVLAYDDSRSVTVYVPPARPEAIVFAGDGQLIAPWGEDLEAADVAPTVVVGTHRSDAEMDRLKEYTPVFDEARFAEHEAFFVDDVHEWVRSRFDVALPAERTAVCGVSASGELALAAGLRHPDIYGTVCSASPGAGFKPPAALPMVLPRVYLVAGTQEPFFLANATLWADALRGASADVVMYERAGEHGGPFWREEFTRMIAWAFD